VSSAVHNQLWDDQDSFYYDRKLDDRFVRVRAATGFLPLLLPDLPTSRAERLVEALKDPQQFNTVFPVPSLAVSHPAWSTDMWRGATWVNLNYLIAKGLRFHDYEAEAEWLENKTIEFVGKYYDQYGVVFEFFDAKDQRPPLACDRKGARKEPYNIRRKSDSIRDYHWTAAMTYCLLREKEKERHG
jgi:glycogen debranching enzyme